ncbi:hypothetical protein KM759_gp109 [Lymphocystis disease virus 4]|uniref:Protein kinase domain-containing protein n=1 Tax=Lymphocystis disease virus 4 TaxID=2704413 RepID=A0A6B9XMI1_9VIRU|nr:hypothetical protein KM759_gp109 [Lymphocystis disease virus 4]QHR78441.1 hypothetical protein [Lymphocystis disease virus 4]
MRSSTKSSKIKNPTIFGKPPESKSSGKKQLKNLNQSQYPSNFSTFGTNQHPFFGNNQISNNFSPFGAPIYSPFGTVQQPGYNPFGSNQQQPGYNPFGSNQQQPGYNPFGSNQQQPGYNPFGSNQQQPGYNPFGSNQQQPGYNPFGSNQQQPGYNPFGGSNFGFQPQPQYEAKPPEITTEKDDDYKNLLLEDLNLTSDILTDDESSDESFLPDDEKPSTSHQNVIPLIVQEASKAKKATNKSGNSNLPVVTSILKSSQLNETDVKTPPIKTNVTQNLPVTAKVKHQPPSKTTTVIPPPTTNATVTSLPTTNTTVTPSPITNTTVTSSPITNTTVTPSPITNTTVTPSPITNTTVMPSPTTNTTVKPSPTTLDYVQVENFEDVYARIKYMNIINGYLKRNHAVLTDCNLTAVKSIAQTERYKMYHVKFKSFYFGCKQTKFKPQKIDFFKDLTGWNNWPDQKTKPPEVVVQHILNDIMFNGESQNLLLSAGIEYLCNKCDAEYVCYNFFTEAVDCVLTESFLTNMTTIEKESIFVQLLCTLAVLHFKYGIVHSNIKLENIALKAVSISSNYFKYVIGDRSFYVKNTGYIPLLCNFDRAYSVHPDYSSSEYYGTRNVIVEKTGLKASWGSRAGREYKQNPLKISKKVTFDTTGKFLALEPNTSKIPWTDGQEGTFNRVYDQNKENIDLKNLRKHPAEDFFRDIDALLKIFAPYEKLKIGNDKNKILYGLTGLRYLFADLTAAYLFPEIGDYGLYEREYKYTF